MHSFEIVITDQHVQKHFPQVVITVSGKLCALGFAENEMGVLFKHLHFIACSTGFQILA